MKLHARCRTAAGAFRPSLRADERALNLPIGDPARKDREVAVVLDGITDAARGDVITPGRAGRAARRRASCCSWARATRTWTSTACSCACCRSCSERGRQVLIGLEMYPVTGAAVARPLALGPEADARSASSPSRTGTGTGATTGTTTATSSCSRAKAGIRMFGGQRAARRGADGAHEGLRRADTGAEGDAAAERIDTESAEHKQLFRAFFGSTRTPCTATCRTRCSRGCSARSAPGTRRWAGTPCRRCKKHGGEKAIMVVLIGSGHVAYGLGAERQAKLWFDGRTASRDPGAGRGRGATGKPLEQGAGVVRETSSGACRRRPTRSTRASASRLRRQKSGERYTVIDGGARVAGRGRRLQARRRARVDRRRADRRQGDVATGMMSEKRWGDVGRRTR